VSVASQNGSWLYDATEYSKIADTDGIAVVFPEEQGASSQSLTGSLAPWSVTDGDGLCGLGTLVSNPNAIALSVRGRHQGRHEAGPVHRRQARLRDGFSMGGYFSHHIACDRPDFRAAGPHSGGTIASLDACKTAHMPIIMFHGTSDPLINDACDDPVVTAQAGFPRQRPSGRRRTGARQPTRRCGERHHGNNGQCYLYDGCPADGQVEVCTFTNMAHAWQARRLSGVHRLGRGLGKRHAARVGVLQEIRLVTREGALLVQPQ